MRRNTKLIWVGNVPIGSDYSIVVQSMTNTDTRDIKASIAQIRELWQQGCQIIRLAVVDEAAAIALASIKAKSPIPIIADIHFDYHLALLALKAGVDGLRINPGNIGSKEKIKAVILEAKSRHIPIRIGVNGGSLEKDILKKNGGVTSEGLVESGLRHIEILEDFGFYNIKISLKASNVTTMINAYELLAKEIDYPFHIGVTEAGTLKKGLIKSAVGIGTLLNKGLGDTLRVSLTDDPKEEIVAGFTILKTLDLKKTGAELISCPTCGRTEIDLINLAAKVEAYIEKIKAPITVAVMGCPVNGFGEAREADIGIAGGKSQSIIFKKGQIIKKVKEDELFSAFIIEIDKLIEEFEEENRYARI